MEHLRPSCSQLSSVPKATESWGSCLCWRGHLPETIIRLLPHLHRLLNQVDGCHIEKPAACVGGRDSRPATLHCAAGSPFFILRSNTHTSCASAPLLGSRQTPTQPTSTPMVHCKAADFWQGNRGIRSWIADLMMHCGLSSKQQYCLPACLLSVEHLHDTSSVPAASPVQPAQTHCRMTKHDRPAHLDRELFVGLPRHQASLAIICSKLVPGPHTRRELGKPAGLILGTGQARSPINSTE